MNRIATGGRVRVRRAALADAADAAAVVTLLDSYASDPRGGSRPLDAPVRERLIPGLLRHPTARVWLAFESAEAVGVCVGFLGFSTFQALPLLNIHDLAVLPGRRGGGVGRALLDAAEQEARAAGCCKLTLEVQDDNSPARHLYQRFGFGDVVYGNSGPTRFLSKALAVLMVLAMTAASVPAAWADDKTDVDATTARWIDAFNRKSTKDIVALYAPDAVFFGTSSPLLRDAPAQVQDYFKDLPALGDAQITLGDHRIQLLGNVAISTGFYTRSGLQDGKVVRNPARFTFVYQKRGEQWLIINHHSSALPEPAR